MKNRQLSGGMKRRVGLVQAMLSNPDLLIIDEPTAGVDPEERIKIRKLLSDFGKNRTVIFSTHVVEDLVFTSNQLCVLCKGQVKYKGTVRNMLKLAEGHCFLCKIDTEEISHLEKKDIYIVNKMYDENGITVKIIARQKPNNSCNLISPNLEDAYIYINHFLR